MSQNPNFVTVGRLRATISQVSAPVNGVSTKTGEAYTYVTVRAYPENSTEYVEKNILINQYNKLEDIKVGAIVDVVSSQEIATGKINQSVFIASNKLTVARILEMSGASAEIVAAGKSQAADAVRARMAARAAARG